MEQPRRNWRISIRAALVLTLTICVGMALIRALIVPDGASMSVFIVGCAVIVGIATYGLDANRSLGSCLTWLAVMGLGLVAIFCMAISLAMNSFQ